MTWNRIASWSLILAPAGQVGGWALMRAGGNEGAEPQTSIAHTVWLLGFLALAVVCVELYRRVRSRGAGQVVAAVSLTVALASVAASVVEMIIDLYVALSTDTLAQEAAAFDAIRAVPGTEEILYGFGTQLVYLGFVALIVQLTVLRRVGVATLLLIVASLVAFVAYELVLDGNGFGRQVLMPVAVGFMWAALAPLGWRMLRRPRTRTRPAAVSV